MYFKEQFPQATHILKMCCDDCSGRTHISTRGIRRRPCHVTKHNNTQTIQVRRKTPILFGMVLLLIYQLPTPTDGRSLQLVASYSTILGLAAQSARWKGSMEFNLEKLAEKSAEAMAWQIAAEEDEAAANDLSEASVVAEKEGEVLQQEGNVLITKAEADEAKATTMESDAGALGEDAVAKEGEAIALFEEAATEETAVEEATAKATADAALAAEKTTSAEVDEAATGFCQVIPLLDVVCDIVGGIAAVGLAASSVRKAALATEEFAAAATAQAEVSATIAKATDLQAAAAEEGEESASLQASAAALETEAETEMAEGEADKTAAEGEFAESVAEREASGGEEMKAAGEEEASARAWKESTKHGALACRDALMVLVVSAITGLFFVFRIGGSIVLSLLGTAAMYIWNILKTKPSKKMSTSPAAVFSPSAWGPSKQLLAASHLFHHSLLFIIFFGFWGNYLLQMRQFTSIKVMGGIVVMFALSMAAVQSLVMHSIPKACIHYGSTGSGLWGCFREFWRRLLVLSPLIVMELLLLWVNAGKWLFEPSFVEAARQSFLWNCLAITLLAHYFMVHCRRLSFPAEESRIECKEVSHDETQLLLSDEDQEKGSTNYGTTQEEEGIIEEAEHWENIHSQSQTQIWFHQEVLQDMKDLKLLLVFELLMASVMFALFLQATPTLWKLWPASKTLLMSEHPHWRLLAMGAGMASLLLILCACL